MKTRSGRRAGYRLAYAACCAGAAWLTGCAVVDSAPAPKLARGDEIAVLPIVNHTETPQAGERAASIAAALLAADGFARVSAYPASGDDQAPFDTAAAPDAAKKALDWARDRHARYALTGTVTEWRYKVGVDGEPAVGLTLQLLDVDGGGVIWSAAGSSTGWSRASLAGVAQKLERKLLAPLAQH